MKPSPLARLKSWLARADAYLGLQLLLALGNACLLARLLLLAGDAYPFTDDHWFLELTPERGGWGTAKFLYATWGGRFGAYLITCAVVEGYQAWGTLFHYYGPLILGLGFFIYKNVAVWADKRSLRFRWHQLTLGNIAGLIVGVWWLAAPEISAFYWLCASVLYYGGILSALVALYLLFAKLHSTWIVLPFLFLTAGYAGNSVETFGTTWLMGLGAYFGYVLYQQKNLGKINLLHLTKVGCALAGAATGWAILMLAPGNSVRMQYFPNGGWVHLAQNLRRNLPYFLTEQLPEMLLPYSFLTIIFFYLGSQVQKRPSGPEPDLARQLVIGLAVVAGLILCALLPPIFATGGVGPGRSMAGIAFLLLLLVAYFSLRVGQFAVFPRRVAFLLALVFGLAYSYKQRSDLLNHRARTHRFATEYGARLAYLRQLKAAGQRAPVTLKRVTMPPSIFPFSELSPDPAQNGAFQRAYQLDFPVRIE